MPSLTSGGVARLQQAAEPDSQLTLQVLTIYRSMLDQERRCADPRKRDYQFPECADAYELVLSDGRQKLKVGLSTMLNELVYKGQLMPLGLVRVRDWSAMR